MKRDRRPFEGARPRACRPRFSCPIPTGRRARSFNVMLPECGYKPRWCGKVCGCGWLVNLVVECRAPSSPSTQDIRSVPSYRVGSWGRQVRADQGQTSRARAHDTLNRSQRGDRRIVRLSLERGQFLLIIRGLPRQETEQTHFQLSGRPARRLTGPEAAPGCSALQQEAQRQDGGLSQDETRVAMSLDDKTTEP